MRRYHNYVASAVQIQPLHCLYWDHTYICFFPLALLSLWRKCYSICRCGAYGHGLVVGVAVLG